MTERLGAIKLGQEQGEVFLGRDYRPPARLLRGASPRRSTRRSAGSSRPRTTRPARSSSRTATCSTPWCVELLEKETLDKEEVARDLRAARASARAPGVDRLVAQRPPSDRRRSLTARARSPRPNGALRNGLGATGASRADVQIGPGRLAHRRPRPRGRRRARMAGPDHAARARPGGPGADFDHARAEAAVRELLLAIGEDPDRDGLRDTPARVARAYAEMFAGLRQAPGGRAHDHLRPRPRRDGAGEGHRGLLHVRAPPRAVPRGRPRRLHPQRRRPHHRAVEAGPPRRRLRQAPAGAGAAHHAGRRRAGADPASRAASSW